MRTAAIGRQTPLRLMQTRSSSSFASVYGRRSQTSWSLVSAGEASNLKTDKLSWQDLVLYPECSNYPNMWVSYLGSVYLKMAECKIAKRKLWGSCRSGGSPIKETSYLKDPYCFSHPLLISGLTQHIYTARGRGLQWIFYTLCLMYPLPLWGRLTVKFIELRLPKYSSMNSKRP